MSAHDGSCIVHQRIDCPICHGPTLEMRDDFRRMWDERIRRAFGPVNPLRIRSDEQERKR